jgi:hypothetical protein
MVLTSLILLTLLAAPADYTARVDVLRKHVERLQAITVSENDQDAKATKLAQLAESLNKPIGDEEAYKALYREIDAVRTWLLTQSINKPTTYPGTIREVEGSMELTNGKQTIRISKKDGQVTLIQSGYEWRMAPCDNTDIELEGKSLSLLSAQKLKVVELRTGYSIGLLATLTEFEQAPGLELILGIHLSDWDVLFEITPLKEGVPVKGVNWPKPIQFETQAPQDYSVLPYMQGALIPANWSNELKRARGLCQTRWFYMPWWGQVRGGHGIQAIFETTFDGGGDYVHPAGGPTKVSPHWFSSLGNLRYPRRIRYFLDEVGSYVTMAKRYRQYAKENGHFVSLKEKLVRSPQISEVIGKPVVHLGSLYHFVEEARLYNQEKIENNHALTPLADLAAGLRKLKQDGIEDAYVHLDGWGFRGYDNTHPDVLPPGQEQGGWEGLREFAKTCKELGYLFAVHDNYRDFYKSAVSYDPRLALQREDGSLPEDATWCGGPQAFLSARFAQEYVRRNHDLFAANGVQLEGAYLDVFAVADLDESFQPAYPMSREDCARFRLSCFDLLRARGYVISSEEPVDFAVPSLDLVHHGPYPTYPNLGGGTAVGIPVPLFSLVYHDSILLPWDMGEDGGWGTPKGDAGRLHCLLNAGLPYTGPGATPEQIKQVKEACALAERLAFQELVNHEFLDDTKRRQRTTYADGTQVTVNFDTKEYRIEP